jgi:hypothetical protein
LRFVGVAISLKNNEVPLLSPACLSAATADDNDDNDDDDHDDDDG